MDSGRSKYDSLNYNGAILDLNKAIELDQNNSQAYLIRADVKFDLHDYKESIADDSIAIAIDPKTLTC